MRIDVLGIGFDSVTLAEAVQRAVSWMGDGRPHYIVTPNPEIVFLCQNDEEARSAVCDADMVLPDGIGVVKASRALGRPLAQRVPGIDFAAALFPVLVQHKKKLFLLGAKPGVAEAAAARLRDTYPGLQICGVADGYFKDSQEPLRQIRDHPADVVFVCLGAPKQEKWMAQHIGLVGNALLVGLGGCLDVWSGRVRRAPKVFIALGLEWLYRLLCQPSRLGRMLVLPRFWMAVRRQKKKEKEKD